jgi:hypothetical protein
MNTDKTELHLESQHLQPLELVNIEQTFWCEPIELVHRETVNYHGEDCLTTCSIPTCDTCNIPTCDTCTIA